jgi:hypothetical protein
MTTLSASMLIRTSQFSYKFAFSISDRVISITCAHHSEYAARCKIGNAHLWLNLRTHADGHWVVQRMHEHMWLRLLGRRTGMLMHICDWIYVLVLTDIQSFGVVIVMPDYDPWGLARYLRSCCCSYGCSCCCSYGCSCCCSYGCSCCCSYGCSCCCSYGCSSYQNDTP